MDFNLPEIEVKGQPEKKKRRAGLIPFLFGSSKGMLTLATAMVVGGVVLTPIISNLDNAGKSKAKPAVSAAVDAPEEDYIPEIMRNQGDSASALALLAEKNKGKLDFDAKAKADEAKKAAEEAAAKAEAEAAAKAQAEAAAKEKQAQADAEKNAKEMAEGMAAQAGAGGLNAGAGTGKLTTQLGGGNGGFKSFKPMDKTFASSKVGFNNVMGTLSKPNFSNTKPMRNYRNSSAGGDAASKLAAGKGAYKQAAAIKGMVSSNQGQTSIDAMKHTESQAWEGQTTGGEGVGSQVGGVGVSQGGLSDGAVASSPSLDNTYSVGGGSSDDQELSDAYGNLQEAETPWSGRVKSIKTLIGIAFGLCVAAALIRNVPIWGHIAAIALCGVAAALSATALGLSISVGTVYGQSGLATALGAASGLGLTAAGLALAGLTGVAAGGIPVVTVMLFGAGSVLLGALTGNMGGVNSKYANTTADKIGQTSSSTAGSTRQSSSGNRR